MYTIHDYGDMSADRIRTTAYVDALRHHIAPESVVLDLGAGTGMLTLLACQAGAKKVYAIEADGALQVARELIARNGFSDRVECIQALSTDVTLSEQVDVIVSDVHGVLPLYSHGILSIIDARRRFLKPEGALIPQEDTLWAALVSAPSLYDRLTAPWEQPFGLDGSAGRRRAVNSWLRWQGTEQALVVEPQQWLSIDYAGIDDARRASGSLGWTVARACDVHGIAVWFNCRTSDNHGFSNSPSGSALRVYQQGFFPLERVLRLENGDRVQVEIRADLVADDYVWSWNTEVTRAEQRLEAFRQSQFFGASVESDRLRKTASTFVPVPTPQAAIDRVILDLLFTPISLEDVARRVAAEFPDRFPDWTQAFDRVARLSARYSE